MASVSSAQQEQSVQLRALDGSAVVTGELIEVSDGSYVVETDLGVLRIPVDETECVGEACPTAAQLADNRPITTTSQVDDLTSPIPILLQRYAQNIGAGFQVEGKDRGPQQVSILGGETETLRAKIDLKALDEDDGAVAVSIPQDGASDLQVFTDQNIPSPQAGQNKLLLALEGIAIVVHPDNPISNLSTQVIAELFSCSRANWRSLGGSPGQVSLYVTSDLSDAYDAFSTLILNAFDAELCDTATEVQNEAELAARVANDVNAIGFLSLRETYDAKPIAIGECETLAIRPSIFSVKTEEYPLARRIFVHAPGKASSTAAQKFIDFALSDGGQKQLQGTRLIDLAIDTTRNYASDYRLARLEAAAIGQQVPSELVRLADATEDADRLSATFRFKANANALDDRSLEDLNRLADYLRNNANDEGKLLVFGFTDTSGGYEQNLALSEQRAQSIADRLRSLGVEVAAVTGFGEEAPVACNDDLEGRAMNRRVEIWLRS